MLGIEGPLRRFEWKTNGVFPPVITVLVALNIVAFFADVLSQRALFEWFAVNWATVAEGQVWRLLSAGFLHANFPHLLFNLLFYCFFAHSVHRELGAHRFLWLTLLAIMVGNLAQVGCQGLGYFSDAPVLGFSGAFLATIVAFATINPHATTVFIIIQLPAWLLAVVLVLLDLAGVFGHGGQTAHVAHLGGAAIGFLFVTFPRAFLWNRWFQRFSNQLTAAVEQRQAARQAKDEAYLDELLEKVSTRGLPALSEAERRFLQRFSKHKQSDE